METKELKQYKVNVHYDVVLQAEVTAKSEEDAIAKAIEETGYMSLNDGDVVGTNACVTYTKYS